MSLGAFLVGAWPAILIVAGIIALAGLILWLVFGRKPGKEDSADRILRPMAVMKGHEGTGGGGGGRTSVR